MQIVCTGPRTDIPIGLLAWLLLSLLWSAGGWLLAMHIFRLRRGESLVANLASGLLLFIVFANLLGQLLPLDAAFWIAAASILVLGLLSARREDERFNTLEKGNQSLAADPDSGRADCAVCDDQPRPGGLRLP